MRKIVSYFLILTIILLLPSCSDKNDNNTHRGGTIKIFAYEPDSFNPIKTEYQTNASLFADTIYLPLIQVEKDLSLTPVIAKGWKFTENGSTLIVTIREDLKFSDGTKVSAKHVKNVIETIKNNPDSLYGSVNDYIEECTTSENILTLKLKKNGSGVLYNLDIPIYKDNSSLLGCGPYVLKEKKDTGFILSANNKNANKDFRPNIETIEVVYFPSKEAAVNAFNASEIDAVSCDINSLSTLSTKSNVASVDFVNEKFTFLGFNCDAPSVSKVQTRSAINTLINKSDLVETKLAGYASATTSPFKPGSIFEASSVKDSNPDTSSAIELLKKESFQSFTLLINKESVSKKNVAEYIKEKMREHGITVHILSVSYEEYLKKIEENDYTVYVGEVIIPPDQDLNFLLHSDSKLLNFSNDKMDKHLKHFSSATNEKDLIKQAENIQSLLTKETPIISLYYEKEIFFTSNKIKSKATPRSNSLYNDIYKWYVK